MSYREFIPSSVPAWLQTTQGVAFLESIGITLDSQMDLAREATLVRFPSLAPSDALPALGNERGIEAKYEDDTDASYAERIRHAWDRWPVGGSGNGLSNALVDLGYPNHVIVTQGGNAYQTDVNGDLVLTELGDNPLIGGGVPWWTFDNNDDFYNRFAVLFYPPFNPRWVDIQSPPTASSAPSDAEMDFIVRVINRWKSAKALLVGVFALLDYQCIGWPVRIIGNGTTIVPAGSTNGGAVLRLDL